MTETERYISRHFPKVLNYDPEWVKKHSMGENVLYNLESMLQKITLKEGMRVLDLACGKAVSSIFMAKEYKVKVWAVDEAISATENFKRVQEAGCEEMVFPVQADARLLPFPKDYFDVIIVIDSYTYFGTDDKYLPYITKFLKQGGFLGIVDVCFRTEIETFGQVPAFLKEDYQNYWYYVHAIEWWKKLWEKTGLMHVTCAEELPQQEFIKNEYIKDYKNETKEPFAEAIKNDDAGLISFFRLVGKRTSKDAYLQDYTKTVKKP